MTFRKRLDFFVQGYWSKMTALSVVLIITLIHFAYSFLSDGMLQGEEGVQYTNMKRFWHNPNTILGNWAKTGWKLIYVWPAVLGFQFLKFFNAVVAALCAYYAFLLAKEKDVKVPVLAIVILLSQFLWIELGFRNYSELVTALILVVSVYYHYKEKFILAALLLSYTLIIRQEMLPILGLYGLYLLYKREWVAALCIAAFPLLVNAWGWAVSGDPMHFLSGMISASQSFLDQYPRQGFWHYTNISFPIYGTICLLGVLMYLMLAISKKVEWYFFILVPALIFFGVHTAFQWQSVKIGTSTGGNWRYIIVISPLLAVMACIGWDKIRRLKLKKISLIVSIPLLIGAIVIASYEHNYVLFSDVRDWSMGIMAGIVLIIPLLRLKRVEQFGILLILAIAFNAWYLKPIKLQGEDKTMKEIAKWCYDNGYDKRPVYSHNAMLYFFMDKVPEDYEKGYFPIDQASLESAPIESIIFWETHYTMRFGNLNYDYLQNRPEQYKLLRQDQSNDNRFVILIFEKIST